MKISEKTVIGLSSITAKKVLIYEFETRKRLKDVESWLQVFENVCL